MAEAAREITLMSSEDYLARENDGERRHEFVNGVVYALVGTSDRHNVIAGALDAALLGHLPRRCQVFMADMKLQVRRGHDQRFHYPDVFVSCAPSQMGRYTREEPLLVAEVLSASTERVDRGESSRPVRRCRRWRSTSSSPRTGAGSRSSAGGPAGSARSSGRATTSSWRARRSRFPSRRSIAAPTSSPYRPSTDERPARGIGAVTR